MQVSCSMGLPLMATGALRGRGSTHATDSGLSGVSALAHRVASHFHGARVDLT